MALASWLWLAGFGWLALAGWLWLADFGWLRFPFLVPFLFLFFFLFFFWEPSKGEACRSVTTAVFASILRRDFCGATRLVPAFWKPKICCDKGVSWSDERESLCGCIIAGVGQPLYKREDVRSANA